MDLIASCYSSEDEERDESERNKECNDTSVTTKPAIADLASCVPSRTDTVSAKEQTVGYVSTRKRQRDSTTNNGTMPQNSDACSNLSSALISHPRTIGKYTQWMGHSKAAMNMQWHPTHANLLLSASLDGTVKVWDTFDGGHVAQHTLHTGPVRCAQWTTPTSVLSGSYDKQALHVDMESMKTIGQYTHKDSVTALRCHPTDNNLFVSGDAAKKVQLWDLRTNDKSVNQYTGAGGHILDVQFIKNGAELVASSDIVRRNAASQMLLVWETKSTIVRSNQVYLEPYTCTCIREHPWDHIFMAQSNANYIVIFNSNKPYKMNKHKRYESHSVDGYNVQFDISPEGTTVASGSSNGNVYFYNYHTSRIIKTRHIGSSPVLGVEWNPFTSSTIACSSWDGSITVFQSFT